MIRPFIIGLRNSCKILRKKSALACFMASIFCIVVLNSPAIWPISSFASTFISLNLSSSPALLIIFFKFLSLSSFFKTTIKNATITIFTTSQSTQMPFEEISSKFSKGTSFFAMSSLLDILSPAASIMRENIFGSIEENLGTK